MRQEMKNFVKSLIINVWNGQFSTRPTVCPSVPIAQSFWTDRFVTGRSFYTHEKETYTFHTTQSNTQIFEIESRKVTQSRTKPCPSFSIKIWPQSLLPTTTKLSRAEVADTWTLSKKLPGDFFLGWGGAFWCKWRKSRLFQHFKQ